MIDHSNETAAAGTRDGGGAGDHDIPYVFGRHPTAAAPFPFSTRVYVRVLLFRSRVREGLTGTNDGYDAPRVPSSIHHAKEQIRRR